VTFDRRTLKSYDAALIITDHDDVDYQALVNWSKLVADTGNACKNVADGREKILNA
jgi:UDP-N-acetyl-D-glucosamine dehydrogenase